MIRELKGDLLLGSAHVLLSIRFTLYKYILSCPHGIQSKNSNWKKEESRVVLQKLNIEQSWKQGLKWNLRLVIGGSRWDLWLALAHVLLPLRFILLVISIQKRSTKVWIKKVSVFWWLSPYGITRGLGAFPAPTSGWRPFGPLYFALWARGPCYL